ncbi:MAG: ribosomal protein S18-alanine N-acetyltransferase [Syntrophotaleaceae bacterium]
MIDRNIQPMKPCDLEQVLDLEKVCHRNPWSRQIFEEELANELSSIDLLWVGGLLAGLHCYWSFSGEMHILNLATAPVFRRQGLGRLLLAEGIKREIAKGLDRAFLEVRKGNEPAIALYRSFGFAVIGHRRKYYPDKEDALVMALEEKRLEEFVRRVCPEA